MNKKFLKNSITDTGDMQPIRNRIIVRFLRACGYSMRNIRKSLFLLNDVEEQIVAAKMGLKQQTMNKTSLGQRRNPLIQEKIARFFGVPVSEMFPVDEPVVKQ